MTYISASSLGTVAAVRYREAMTSICHKSILVVDDDAGMRRALKKVLSGEGAAVTCAKWAADAIKILTQRRKQIDLVITDLSMPHLTGVSLVYAAHRIFPALPVIVFSAFGSPEVKALCREHGVAAFLDKPLDTAQLVEAIENALVPSQTDSEAGATQGGEAGVGAP